jgi:para-nitrobenzyl esterase
MSDNQKNLSQHADGPTRRNALLLTATGIGATLGAGEAVAGLNTATINHLTQGGITTPHAAVASTAYGKVRGYVEGGVYTFKGVPYGADTAGANRWLPAKPPTPWEGERPTLIYGGNCPQTLHDWSNVESSFIHDWDDGFLSEDMLKLNIWTPALTGKRPVMVYLHGGGFSFGSSYELASHDGANMARNHDVVQVSVNHRLNALGFLDLSEIGGEAYRDSANVGMTDLVAALQWVRDNIANFGGDPNTVMIYGQSGGGSKVTTLMGMSSAAGLFHRAGVQSGGGGNSPTGQQSRELAKQLMIELGLGPNDIAGLQKTEWSKLFTAGNAAIARINGPNAGFGGLGSAPSGPPRVGWGPTMDGRVLPSRPFHDTAPGVSKNIPLLIGSVSEEGTVMRANPTEAEWRASLAKTHGAAKADALIAAMKAEHPEKTIQKLSYGVGGVGQRNNVQRMVRLKYEQKSAPVYQWFFTWQTPILDGKPGAYHTVELGFCFDNVKRAEQSTGNTPEAQEIGKKMSAAWAAFARTGNPGTPALPWPATDPVKVQTMVFDTHTRMVNDPEAAARKVLLG